MARRRLMSLEALNVEILEQQEKVSDQSSEFDQLYFKTQDAIAQQEAEEPEPDESAPDTPDEPEADTETDPEADPAEDDADADSEAEPVDLPEGKEEVAAEALQYFIPYYQEASSTMLAMEEGFVQRHVVAAGQFTKDQTVAGLKYLKSMGFEYGSLALKHVFKGVLYALERTLKGLVQGVVAIEAYVKRRMESYAVFQTKIAKAQETIELLKSMEKTPEELAFHNQGIISQLKIGQSVDFVANLKMLQKFSEVFFKAAESNVQHDVATAGYLIDSVRKGIAVQPMSRMQIKPFLSGFKPMTISGYRPTSEAVQCYAYNQTLPGDILFLGYLPVKDITDKSQLSEAYANSKLFLGFNEDTVSAIDSMTIPSIEVLEEHLSALSALCELGLTQEKAMTRFVVLRKRLRTQLKGYFQSLMQSQEKLSIEASLAEYINLKVEFIDRTYIAGLMHLHDYHVRILTASLTYIAAGIRAHGE